MASIWRGLLLVALVGLTAILATIVDDNATVSRTLTTEGLLDGPDGQRTEVPRAGGAMEDLLHWAIENSDPDKLKEVMGKYASNNLTLKDVYGQDVIDALFVDEHAVILRMIRTIADFRNTSMDDEDLAACLDRVEDFVEQIDNAGNLHRMGGLAPLLDLGLDGTMRSVDLRAKALLVLGIAAQNNPPVQDDLMSLSGLQRVVSHLPGCAQQDGAGGTVSFCSKLLFVVSALVKNKATIQVLASDFGAFEWMMGPGLLHPSLVIAKKAMGIVETVVAQNADLSFLAKLGADTALQSSVERALLNFVGGVPGGDPLDVDTPEKALRLISRLLVC